MLKFTSDHEWILLDDDCATVGITEYAQEQLGDLVFVQLPKPSTNLQAGAVAAVVESVKAASEVYAPIDGEVVAVNDDVSRDPTLINSDPMKKGWLFKLKVSKRAQFDVLLDEQAYRSMLERAA
ncbi:MAG: glycine cleavage system protein GcvH [Xanthobacteraceae bacterium]